MDRFHVNRDRPLPVLEGGQEPPDFELTAIDDSAPMTPEQWEFLLKHYNETPARPNQ